MLPKYPFGNSLKDFKKIFKEKKKTNKKKLLRGKEKLIGRKVLKTKY